MLEWLSGKPFETADIPDDIAQKREKAAKRAEKAAAPAAPAKQNKSAAAKKLKKQLEGLDLAESFVKDMLSRGVYSANSAAADQYRALAKQLGDYWLPGLQEIMNRIVDSVQYLTGDPGDKSMRYITSLLIRLAATVKKSRQYITAKLESGDVLPEDSVLYEELGGVWKLSAAPGSRTVQGKRRAYPAGLLREQQLQPHRGNRQRILARPRLRRDILHAEYPPGKGGKIPEAGGFRDRDFPCSRALPLPRGLNPRVRWEAAEISAPDYSRVLEKAGTSIAEAVKTAKNDLKNTLSEPYAGVLLRFDEIQLADKRRAVLKLGEESITLQAYYRQFPNCCDILSFVDSRRLHDGALFGLMYYAPEDHRMYLCPMSIVHTDGITKLC